MFFWKSRLIVQRILHGRKTHSHQQKDKTERFPGGRTQQPRDLSGPMPRLGMCDWSGTRKSQIYPQAPPQNNIST